MDPPVDAPVVPGARPAGTAVLRVDGQVGTVVSVASARDLHLHHDVHFHAAGRQGLRAPAQLPPTIAQFTGRQVEVERLLAALGDGDGGPAVVCAIDGKPGIGKSALALRVAHRLAARFEDGQLYVNLQGAHAGGLEPLAPIEVLGRFIRSLEGDDAVIPVDAEEAAARYRSLLAGRRVLVVLDDARDSAQLRPLLPAAPTCAVLVTSRSMLTDLDGARRFPLDVLSPDESVELIGQLAGPDRVAAEPDAARRIARLCGHLPLALRIAGARLATQPGWPLAAFADRLDDERHRLDEFAHGELHVAGSFAVSYRTLDRLEVPGGIVAARVFRLLGLLPGSDFTAPVVAVLLDRPLREAEVAMERLVAAQLVEQPTYADMEALQRPLPGRYRLHDLLRLYARRLGDVDEPADAARAARARVTDYYLETTRMATVLLRPAYLKSRGDGRGRFRTRAEALDWLAAERENLVAVACQAAEDGPSAHSWQLAQALFRFFDLRRHVADWTAVNEAALTAARAAGDLPAEATALRDLGVIARHQRRYDHAVDCFRASLAIFERLGRRRDEGLTLNHLGQVYRRQRRFDDATACGRSSLRLHREIGDRHGEAMALDHLGVVGRQVRRFPEAEASLWAAMAIFRDLGDRHGEGISRGNLGDVARHDGRYDEAAEHYRAALGILAEVDDRYGTGVTLSNLGRVWLGQGKVAAAIEWFEQSLLIRREIGDRHGEGVSLYGLAEAYRALGEHQRAVRYYAESLRIREEVDHRHGQGIALLGLGHAYRALHRWDDAVAAYTESHHLLVEADDEHAARHSRAGRALAVARVAGEAPDAPGGPVRSCSLGSTAVVRP